MKGLYVTLKALLMAMKLTHCNGDSFYHQPFNPGLKEYAFPRMILSFKEGQNRPNDKSNSGLSGTVIDGPPFQQMQDSYLVY